MPIQAKSHAAAESEPSTERSDESVRRRLALSTGLAGPGPGRPSSVTPGPVPASLSLPVTGIRA